MILVNLDFIQFYQLLVKADLTDKQSLMALINDILVICEKRYALMVSRFSNKWDKQIDNNDQIDVLDLTGPSSEYFLDQSYK